MKFEEQTIPTCVAIILHHNKQSLLAPLFDSLLGQEALTAICLIDNASTDGSIAFTRSHYPQVEIIQNQENLNFGTAYNRAIETRQEDVIFIGNNDIVVHHGSIARALRFLMDHQDVASVSFEGLDPERSNPFPSRSDPLVRFGKVLSPARHFSGPNDFPIESPCFLWGAAVCIRRKVFAEIQFDEDMDWGFEDIDLGWSVSRRTGMRNVFLPGATIFHLESRTVRERFRQRQIRPMVARNAILSFAKNATPFEFLRAAPYMMINLFRCRRRRQLARQVARRLLARVKSPQAQKD